MFDLLRQSISVEERAKGIDNIEQKSEIYLASCLVINPDHPSEQAVNEEATLQTLKCKQMIKIIRKDSKEALW